MSLNVLKADVYRGEFSKWPVVSVLLITVLAANSFAQMPNAAARQTTPFAVASSLPAKPVLLASLRPAPGIVWQRVKTDDRPLDGPVLYQIIFRSSATPGHIPRIANNFTLTNSLISDNGTQVAIGGLAINGNTGIISFANGQTFPGTGGVNSVTSGNNFITIGGTGTNPTVALNTAITDARYLQLGGGTMTGAITFANGQTFPGTGTVTSIATGAGLSGGPITGAGTISITSGGVTNAMLANPSVTINTLGGSGLAGGSALPLGGTLSLNIANGGVTNAMLANPALTVSAGSGLMGGGSVALGGTTTLNLDTTFTNAHYLQLNGGTLTGALSGTTASFSGGVTAQSFLGDGSALTNVTAVTANNALALGGNLAALYKTTAQNDARYLQLSGGTLTGGLVLGATGTANAGAGANSNPHDWTASVFNSNTSTAQAQLFRWQTEAVGNNTVNPTGSFNLLFSGTSNNFTPTETGFSIASNGRITFAPGQSFPAAGLPAAGGDLNGTLSNATVVGLQGTPLVNTPPTNGQVLRFNGSNWAPTTIAGGGGTVTSVGSGLGLTGGPITNSGTLAIDTNVVPQLGASNTFTALNLFSGGAQHPPLGSATPGGGFNSSALDLAASSYNNGAGAAVNQRFRWQAEPLNNNSNNASGSLNLLFAAGNNSMAETGLSIANNGQITFAGGQTFPGSVTSVAPGDGSITIAGTASAPTVAVANGGVTNSKLANPSLTVTAGAGLSGGGSVALGGSTTLSVANAGVTNAMLQNSSLTVNTGSGLSGGGAVALGGTLTLNNAGVLSVAASGPLASSGGANPNISLTGTVPVANGGTGITTAPASSGQYLRSSGVATWAVGGIQAGDVPSLSGLYVDLVNNQSIGGNKSFSQTVNATVTSGSGVNASSSDPNGIALLGVASDVTGSGGAIGVEGRTTSPTGAGVFGETTDTSLGGAPTAVFGHTSSPNGTGVFGFSKDTSDSGFTVGVQGQIAGPNGYAVVGVATDTTGGTGGTGSTVGVRGVSASPNGIALLGRATSTTANAGGIGVNGRSDSPNGAGVRGVSADTTGAGLAVGVLGLTNKITNPAALFNNNDPNCTDASCQVLWGQAKGSNVFKVLGNGAVQATAYQDLNGNPLAGVASVSATAPLSSSGGATPTIALNGIVPVANGGTGSAAQNFVDLTTNQNNIGGNKTFTGNLTGANASFSSVGIGDAVPGAKLDIAANGGHVLAGDAGCFAGFAGIGFGTALTGCGNYSLLGQGTDTIINRPTGGVIDFRENNVTQATIAHNGGLIINTTANTEALMARGTGFWTGYFENDSNNPSYAVQGVYNNPTHSGYGVFGWTNGTGGVGIYGLADNASGNGTMGVYGANGSLNGTAGVFNNTVGGKILSGQNNSVEKFSVDGNGNVVATAYAGDGSALTNVNAGKLGGQLAANYARTDAGNNLNGVENLGRSANVAIAVFNEGTTGTTQNRLAKINPSGNAIIAGAGDTSEVLGIVVAGSGTTGSAQIAMAGVASCDFDSASQHSGDYVTISATVAGECHDAGTALPMGTEVIGRVIFTSSTVSDSIYLYGPEHHLTPAILSGYCIGTAPSSALNVGLFNLGSRNETCADGFWTVAFPPAPTDGFLKNLQVVADTGGINASSGKVTVAIVHPDGTLVLTGMSCTLGTAKSCSDTTTVRFVSAGDGIGIGFSTQAGETLAGVRASISKF